MAGIAQRGRTGGLPSVAVIQSRDCAFRGKLSAISGGAAPTLGITVVSAPCGNAAHIESAFDARAREGGGGIIGIPDTFIVEHRDLIIELAAWHHLPAVYGTRDFVLRGGLLAYSADFVAIFHRAASYVDQTLRGVRPGELPVQAPDKFTLSVNLRAAGAIGLTLPPNLIARADEVIE